MAPRTPTTPVRGFEDGREQLSAWLAMQASSRSREEEIRPRHSRWQWEKPETQLLPCLHQEEPTRAPRCEGAWKVTHPHTYYALAGVVVSLDPRPSPAWS